MRYDPQTTMETIMTWKRNYKIIRSTLAYLFLSVLLVTQDKLFIKETGNIFKKHTLIQEYWSGTNVAHFKQVYFN